MLSSTQRKLNRASTQDNFKRRMEPGMEAPPIIVPKIGEFSNLHEKVHESKLTMAKSHSQLPMASFRSKMPRLTTISKQETDKYSEAFNYQEVNLFEAQANKARNEEM